MASKVSATTDDTLVNLTECGICLLEIENPKALPCLHSFCLDCLKEVKHPPGIFICPLCQEQMNLPPGGVDGLRDNFFINQLKDWKVIQKIGTMKILCVCCKSTDQDTKARCMDCNGFLCRQCVSSHKTLTPLAGHKLFSIDELRSDTTHMSQLMKGESCHTHRDQVLKWFCKTCNTAICCECAVVNHVRPDHDYITIESATEGHIQEIKTLMSNCKIFSQQLKDTIGDTEEVKSNLSKDIDNIKKELDQEKKAYIEAIHRSYEENMVKLAKIQKDQLEKINSTTNGFEFMQSKLTNTMEIVSQVINYGSKHNMSSYYSTICTALTKFNDSYQQGISMEKNIGIVKFKSSQRGKVKTVDIGTVSIGERHSYRNGRWSFEKDIFRQGATSNTNGIAISSNRSILVAEDWRASIKVFDRDGNLKQEIKENLIHPNDIAMTPSRFYVADKSPYIKSFRDDGTFKMQFPAISPDGKVSNTDNSKLHGIAIDNDGNILVGNHTKKYISKHRTDGTHISSFPISIEPFIMKVTANNSIVVTSNKDKEPAQILDPNGTLLHTINKPKDAEGWQPSGIACSDDGGIFIANLLCGPGIYSFTENGEYLGCVIHGGGYNGLNRPTGLDIYDDKLVVAQWKGLPGKLYTLKTDRKNDKLGKEPVC